MVILKPYLKEDILFPVISTNGMKESMFARAAQFGKPASVAHLDVEIDREIFSTVILSLPLLQEGQLLVSSERMCTILVNPLED